MDIKQKIIELCNDMIIFWQDLKKNMESMTNGDESTIVCKWHSHFTEHFHAIGKLSDTKRDIDEIDIHMTMREELRDEN